MINSTYSRAYTEVLEIIKYFPEEEYSKIPKEKIEFYNSIGLHELVLVAPRRLMQSVDLSYARYMFYKDKGIDVSIDNYIILFIKILKKASSHVIIQSGKKLTLQGRSK